MTQPISSPTNKGMRSALRALHSQNKFFLFASFAIFSVAASMIFAFFLLNRVRNESAEIEEAKIRRASVEARRGEARREKAAIAELREDIARIDAAFIEYPLAFFEFLENLAARNNLTISLSLEDQTAAEKPEYLRITVSGAYRNLLRFVRSVESSPYATDERGASLQMVNQNPVFSDSLARLIINLRLIAK